MAQCCSAGCRQAQWLSARVACFMLLALRTLNKMTVECTISLTVGGTLQVAVVTVLVDERYLQWAARLAVRQDAE